MCDCEFFLKAAFPADDLVVTCQTSAFVPAFQKIPAGTAKPAESAAKGKGGKQNAEGGTKPAKASKAAAPRGATRGKARPAAAGMVSRLSRGLLHMRIMLCELLSGPQLFYVGNSKLCIANAAKVPNVDTYSPCDIPSMVRSCLCIIISKQQLHG